MEVRINFPPFLLNPRDSNCETSSATELGRSRGKGRGGRRRKGREGVGKGRKGRGRGWRGRVEGESSGRRVEEG